MRGVKWSTTSRRVRALHDAHERWRKRRTKPCLICEEMLTYSPTGLCHFCGTFWAAYPELNFDGIRRLFALRKRLGPKRWRLLRDRKRVERKTGRLPKAKEIYSYEKALAQMRQAYAANPEKFKARSRDFAKRHKKQVQKRQRRWYLKNRTRILRNLRRRRNVERKVLHI